MNNQIHITSMQAKLFLIFVTKRSWPLLFNVNKISLSYKDIYLNLCSQTIACFLWDKKSIALLTQTQISTPEKAQKHLAVILNVPETTKVNSMK